MTRFQKILIRLPDSRLSRRIVIWVFLSVIIIEAIIFFPSFRNREKELLEQMKEISAAKLSVILELIDPGDTDREILTDACPRANGNDDEKILRKKKRWLKLLNNFNVDIIQNFP